jgi:hypothetical protein
MASEAKTLTANNAAELAHWCGGRAVKEHDALDHTSFTPGINVPTNGGASVERASMGDTIIKKHDGTFEIFKSERFGSD